MQCGNSTPLCLAEARLVLATTKMITIPEMLVEASRTNGIVVMAGAGISASPPTSLPGWYPLNRAIFDAVCDRVDTFYENHDYTTDIRKLIHARRNAERFPPDYQAQILEEQSGEVYFQALKAVDVPLYNAGHAGIAQLARHRIVKAVVTTNFDRLIEIALEREGVPFNVAFEPEGYARCAASLENPAANTPLQIVKIHGCVQDHLSMIDTLKQRLLGRNQHLVRCIRQLLTLHLWLYMGFSAADLESDPEYLGISAAADVSPGLVYVQWPGSEKLKPGAEMLLKRYGDKAAVIKAESVDVLATLSGVLDLEWRRFQAEQGDTRKLVSQSLEAWALRMSPISAAMCLAGILEAGGETQAAFNVLHKLWNLRSSKLMADEYFPGFRVMHGRLGMGTGITSLVEDLNSNRGMESIQNLLRINAGDRRALAWEGLAWAWAGNLARAEALMGQVESIFTDEPSRLESRLDVWLAMVEVVYLTGVNVEGIVQNFGAVKFWAEEAGDLPRHGRVSSIFLLLLAEFMPSLFDSFDMEYARPVLDQAKRLNDPLIEGFCHLAQGRLANRRQYPDVALEELSAATPLLSRAGRQPWVLYANIEKAKVLKNLGLNEESEALLNLVNASIDRYQVLLPWYFEAQGLALIHDCRDEEAVVAIKSAIDFAEQMGLHRRADAYRQYLN